MKDLILHLSKCSPTSSVASVRIAYFLERMLGAPIYDQKGKFELPESIDNLYLVNGIGRFCGFLDELEDIAAKSKRVIWVNNDWAGNMNIPTQSRRAINRLSIPVTTLTTIPDRVKLPGDAYVNWNKLTFKLQPFQEMKIPGLFYYGAFRQGRKVYFDRYFRGVSEHFDRKRNLIGRHEASLYPVHISTSTITQKKFKELNEEIQFMKTFKSLSDIGSYQATIYIEDKHNHTEYGSPANRFYECLSVGLPMFFDESTVGTMKTAGYDVSKYVVNSQRDVLKMLQMSEEIRQEQRELWAQRDYLKELEEEFSVAHKFIDAMSGVMG